MRALLAAIFSLLLSYCLFIMGNGLFNTLLGVRARIEGFSNDVTGLVMSGHFIGLLLGSLFAARVVQRVGHIRAFAAFASAMSIVALCHPLWINPVFWFGLRLLTGFSMAGLILVTESWLNTRAPDGKRSQTMALYMTSNYLAAGTGQFLLPLADPGGFRLFIIASILYSLALLPMLLTGASAPPTSRGERAGLGEVLRVSPVAFVGAVFAGLLSGGWFGMGPVFAGNVGFSIPQVSVFMACGVLGGFMLQMPVGRIADRFDRRFVLAAIAAVAAAGAAWALLEANYVISHGGEPRVTLFVAIFIYVGITTTVYSLCNAHANDLSHPERRIQTASGLLLAFAAGASLGPTLSGVVMTRFGDSALFGLFIALHLALSAFAIYRSTRRSAISREETVLLPGGQYTAGKLYASVREEKDRQ